MFQCRKRQCYTRDMLQADVSTGGNISVSMPQAAMLYARLVASLRQPPNFLCFNAASGNAIRATIDAIAVCPILFAVSMPQAAMLYARLWAAGFNFRADLEFQCRKRQCYTRDFLISSLVWVVLLVSMPQAAMLYARRQKTNLYPAKPMTFQCRKRQCYTRDSVSRSPRIYWAQTEIFTTFPFSHRKEAIFRGHRVFKISENIMSALDFQWLIVSTIFCCNLPRFSGQKRKNYF